LELAVGVEHRKAAEVADIDLGGGNFAGVLIAPGCLRLFYFRRVYLHPLVIAG
jgi:hypothetical protein